MKKTFVLSLILGILIIPGRSFAQSYDVYARSQIANQSLKIAELEQRITILEARLDDKFGKVDCVSGIKATVGIDELRIVAASKAVTFQIHAESKCNMDNKNITLKTIKDGEVFGSSITIPITGSIKSSSGWTLDTQYSKIFTRENAEYKFNFIFDGKQTTVPVKVIKGVKF